MTREEKFLRALKEVFIGVPVEGQSGYINLMRIKARYYERGVFPRLMREIEDALQPFPEFREELFDKLYSFFSRYFSESGSIYFARTRYQDSIYEQVYTDDRDVVLFWKTHRLYYVKTDRLFQSMDVEVDGHRFSFDVSTLEHKKANEKRALVFTFKERRADGTLVFQVAYSERGRTTKLDDIRHAIKNALGLPRYTDAVPSEETLERAFRLFERQSEVDYFICKDARAFLREQFDLWMYQYVFKDETEWTEKRIRQLQILKEIAYKIIDFIAQFEDELVRIWNKPKFVLDSHYVITLDRIVAQPGGETLLERILAHPGMEAQVQEWRELGMVDDVFAPEDVLIYADPPAKPVDLFSIARERNLVTTGYHLPYNPKLVERARELRKRPTPAEKKLWEEYLRHFPFPVLRQRPIDHYIVDFYCSRLRLVIEIDGEQHCTEEGKAYDAERDAILRGYGLQVLRFRNEDVLANLEQVRQEIELEMRSLLTPNPLSPLSKGGEGARGSEGIPTPTAAEGLRGSEGIPTPTAAEGPRGSEGIRTKAGEGAARIAEINPRYQYLPLDTRHFPDLELDILALFDHLDEALDGWLVKSENYQALNTLLPKFRGRVKCIYIDPPYNSPETEIHYVNRYRSSSWLTLIENRVEIARQWLVPSAPAFIVAIDDYEGSGLVRLLTQVFRGFEINTFVVNHHPQGSPKANISRTHEYAILLAPEGSDFIRVPRTKGRSAAADRPFMRTGTGRNNFRTGRPNSFYAILIDPVTGLIKGIEEPPPAGTAYPTEQTPEGWLRVYPIDRNNRERVWRKTYRSALRMVREERLSCRRGATGFTIYERAFVERVRPTSNWFDSRYNAGIHGTSLLTDLFGKAGIFSYPKSVYTTRDFIDAATFNCDRALVLDFFAGSGTTAHAVINLNREDGGRRRYILVEMADYFDTVLLPRVKKVVFSDKWKGGRPQEDGRGISHFVKYYQLEQYEDVLRRAHYEDADLFENPYQDPYSTYVFLRDRKMLDNRETGERVVEIDEERGEIRVDLSRLYPSQPADGGTPAGAGRSPLASNPLSPLSKGGEGARGNEGIPTPTAGEGARGSEGISTPTPREGPGGGEGGSPPSESETGFRGSGRIDLAETLSCVTGKWIRRITADYVEFEDGERVSLRNPDWRLIKPLIWW